MRLSRWLGLVGILVVIGCLQVAQRTAITLQGYRVGAQLSELQTQGADIAWRNAQVASLLAPAHLAEVVHEGGMKFVAWSTVEEPSVQPPSEVRMASAGEAAD